MKTALVLLHVSYDDRRSATTVALDLISVVKASPAVLTKDVEIELRYAEELKAPKR